MIVVLTSHRVENLPFLRREFEKNNKIVLEEPKNNILKEVLEGKMEVETYVRMINTQFPVYTSKLLETLRELKDKEILQIEPYLEEVEKLQEFRGGNEKVRDMERKVNLAYLDYVEAFMKGDFDEIIQRVINFAKADAERFVMRDEMRAKEIDFDDATIEAGVMHTKLVELLDAEVVHVPELIADRLNVKYLDTPGNTLTKSFIYEFDCDRELLAARSLIYVTLVEKKEMLPTDSDPFPHFVHEQKVIRFVNKLDYEKCKKVFLKLWQRKN